MRENILKLSCKMPPALECQASSPHNFTMVQGHVKIYTHIWFLMCLFSGVDQSFFFLQEYPTYNIQSYPGAIILRGLCGNILMPSHYSDQLLNCVTIKRTVNGHFNDYLKVWSDIFCSICHNVNIISIFWLVINKTCMTELIFVWPVNMTSKLITIFESCKVTGCWPRFWKNSCKPIP